MKVVSKIFFSFCFLLFSCSSYDDYYPTSGVFCDLSEKEGDCFEILFDKKIFIYKEERHPLISINRASYQTIIQNRSYILILQSEHRIEFNGPNGKKIYNRKKKSKS